MEWREEKYLEGKENPHAPHHPSQPADDEARPSSLLSIATQSAGGDWSASNIWEQLKPSSTEQQRSTAEEVGLRNPRWRRPLAQGGFLTATLVI